MKWQSFIRALLETGLTQVQIAAEAGCGQASISDLATGKAEEPRGSLAVALFATGMRHGVHPSSIWPELAETEEKPAAAPTNPAPAALKIEVKGVA